MEEKGDQLTEMLKEGKRKYFLINVMARRARALAQGARPAVPYQEGASDPIQTAIDEMLAGKIAAEAKDTKAPPDGDSR